MLYLDGGNVCGSILGHLVAEIGQVATCRALAIGVVATTAPASGSMETAVRAKAGVSYNLLKAFDAVDRLANSIDTIIHMPIEGSIVWGMFRLRATGG